LQLVSVLGAGLLVGTALAIIIPEGVRSLNTVVTVHSKNIFIIQWIYFDCLDTWSELVWNKVFFFHFITNGRPATAITIASFTSNYSFCNSINDSVCF